jgi:hypothetical protein
MIDLSKKYRLRNPSVGKLVSELYAFYVEGLRFKVSGVVRLADGDLVVYSWLPDGHFLESLRPLESNFDLVEAAWYEELKDGDPIMVKHTSSGSWLRRYFAGVASNGNVLAYGGGRTKWTDVGTGAREFEEGRRPTAEELAE